MKPKFFKFKKYIYVISCVISLSSCNIETPEELIKPPELNNTKKEILSTIDSFIPENSSEFSITNMTDDIISSMMVKDLNSNEQSEIIFFYKDNQTEKVGMIVAEKNGDKWEKKFNMKFEAFSPNTIWIEDLDGDKDKELVVEGYVFQKEGSKTTINPKGCSIIYYNDREYYNVDMPYYISMDSEQLDNDNIKEIVTISSNTQNELSSLSIFNFKNGSFSEKSNKNMSEIIQPYYLEVGKITPGKKVIFIGYINENYFSDTKVVFYNSEKNTFHLSKDELGIDLDEQILNIKSKDVDGDGIYEIGYKFRSPNFSIPVEDKSENGLVNGYFNIKDSNFVLKKEVYEDFNHEFIINFPKSYKGNYIINVSDNYNETKVNFLDKYSKDYPLITVKRMEKFNYNRDEKIKENSYYITENDEHVIFAYLENDISNMLLKDDLEKYRQMRTDSKNLEVIIETPNS